MAVLLTLRLANVRSAQLEVDRLLLKKNVEFCFRVFCLIFIASRFLPLMFVRNIKSS